MIKVCMIGLGYIGLPTAAMMASRGLEVVGVDVNPKVVISISKGEVHIVEPDLDMLVHAAVKTGKLKACSKPEQADVFMIAVPTPFKEGKKPDLSYVKAAVESIAPHLKPGNLVILESTSPVGTTAQIAAWIQALRPDLKVPQENDDIVGDIYVAYCPERVLPGKVLQELVENDRIIGGLTTFGADKAAKFYQLFVKGECIKTKARTAAMCKLTENAYRDVNIAFANELSMICDEQGIDVWELRELANRHPRVNILKPGPGVGGHCIAVDPWFIVDAAPKVAKIIRTAREVNDFKSDYVVEQVISRVEDEKLKQVVFWGLSFKSDIDDLRESPAVRIVEKFSKAMTNIRINVVEPHINELPESLKTLNDVLLVEAELAEINSAALHVFLVNHKDFNYINDSSLGHTLNFCGVVREETTVVGIV